MATSTARDMGLYQQAIAEGTLRRSCRNEYGAVSIYELADGAGIWVFEERDSHTCHPLTQEALRQEIEAWDAEDRTQR